MVLEEVDVTLVIVEVHPEVGPETEVSEEVEGLVDPERRPL